MPLSHYLKIFSHPGQLEQRLLFSTRTGGLAVLSADVLAAVRANRAAPGVTASLADLSMVVDDPEREREELMDGYGQEC